MTERHKRPQLATVNPYPYMDTRNLMEFYSMDMGNHPLLSREEEQKLASRIRQGKQAQKIVERGVSMGVLRKLEEKIASGKEARDKFIASNLRLVVSIAKDYLYTDKPFLDIIQTGNIGLMRAVEKFDPDRGHKFSSYAHWVVEGEILNWLKKRDMNKNNLSLDAPSKSNPDSTFYDILPDNSPDLPTIVHQRILRSQIVEVMRDMPSDQVEVLILRYGLLGDEPLSVVKITQLLGLDRRTVSALERQAIQNFICCAQKSGYYEYFGSQINRTRKDI